MVVACISINLFVFVEYDMNLAGERKGSGRPTEHLEGQSDIWIKVATSSVEGN